MPSSPPPQPPVEAAVARRDMVLASALATFARFGYRKTSMEDVARAAEISRPGLYFLFTSKELLFRAAVTRALERDLADAERALADSRRPVAERLLAAFDHWAGRYVGPPARDLGRVVEDNPDLLGPILQTAPERFEVLVTDAIARALGPELAGPVARTLISTSVGLKHQVDSQDAYLARLETAISLLLR